MPRRRWCLTAALGLCVVAIPATFRGEILDVLQLPDPPILVGWGLEYTVGAEYPTGEYAAEWRCAGDPPGNWTGLWPQSDPSFLFYFGRVGTVDLRFWAEEEPDIYEPPVWNEMTVQTTFLGPDKDEVASGLNVNSTDDEVEVRFDVLRGEDLIGQYIEGYAQEKVIVHDHIAGTVSSTDWIGPTVGRFYWDDSGAQIVDVKQADMSSAGAQSAEIGFVMLEVFQRNRFVIKDCLGVDQYFEFPPRHFEVMKTDDDTWKLFEVPQPE